MGTRPCAPPVRADTRRVPCRGIPARPHGPGGRFRRAACRSCRTRSDCRSGPSCTKRGRARWRRPAASIAHHVVHLMRTFSTQRRQAGTVTSSANVHAKLGRAATDAARSADPSATKASRCRTSRNSPAATARMPAETRESATHDGHLVGPADRHQPADRGGQSECAHAERLAADRQPREEPSTDDPEGADRREEPREQKIRQARVGERSPTSRMRNGRYGRRTSAIPK